MKPISALQLTLDGIMFLVLIIQLISGKNIGSLWITLAWVFIASLSHINVALLEKKDK